MFHSNMTKNTTLTVMDRERQRKWGTNSQKSTVALLITSMAWSQHVFKEHIFFFPWVIPVEKLSNAFFFFLAKTKVSADTKINLPKEIFTWKSLEELISAQASVLRADRKKYMNLLFGFWRCAQLQHLNSHWKHILWVKRAIAHSPSRKIWKNSPPEVKGHVSWLLRTVHS